MALKKQARTPEKSEAVLEITCSSWEEFKSKLLSEHDDERGPLYRGHAGADWKLASPWERELERSGSRSQESNTKLLAQLLANFKDLTIGLPGIRALDLPTDDDLWTLGRHYGLVTPLLDWTRSPYVAAFFAFTSLLEKVSPGATTLGNINLEEIISDKSAAPVAIWSFMSHRVSQGGHPPQGLEIVSSRTDIGHRQRAQQGVFTRLSQGAYLCLEDYLKSLQPKHPPLLKYLVPGWEASAAIRELRMMNITFATLFPDLTGAVLQANFEMALPTLSSLASLSQDQDTWSSLITPTKD